MQSLSAHTLARWQAEGKALRLLDVRKAQVIEQSGVQIANAEWKNPALWLDARYAEGGMAAWQEQGLPVQALART
jgi:hypothetical protein